MDYQQLALSQHRLVADIPGPGNHGILMSPEAPGVLTVYAEAAHVKRITDALAAANIAVLGRGDGLSYTTLVVQSDDGVAIKKLIQE